MSESKHGLKRSANQYGTKKGPKLIEKVLESLRQGYTPKEAAANAGVDRKTIFNWRNEDPEFAAAWLEAVEEGTDRIEAEAFRRAVDGVSRPVFQQGCEVGRVQEYSDTLLMLLIKGRRPGQFNTERHQHVGGDNGPIETKADVTVRFVAVTKKDDE